MQQHLDTITNKGDNISSQENTKIQHSATESGELSTILGGLSQLFSTPVIGVTGNNQPSGSAQNPPNRTPSGTPKISVIS